MRANAMSQEEMSKNVKLAESLVIPVLEVYSHCFVCHHQERFLGNDPAFDSAPVEASAFRPDTDSRRRFGFIIVGPKWIKKYFTTRLNRTRLPAQ
jgi:hypothetical protein